MTFALLGLLVFASSAGIDYSHACYVRALTAGSRCRAANWSVGQWAAASVGFVIAVKISVWLLPFEGAGLFVGTLLAVKAPPRCQAAGTLVA